MKEQRIAGATESRPVWEGLETFAAKGCRGCCNNCWRKRSSKPWDAPATHAATAPPRDIGTGSYLHGHGLAHGDFDLALRGLRGAAAPLSASAIARLKAGWQADTTGEAPAAR